MQTAPVRLRKRALVAKFFADRGTHLAAMVAYFALLSFVPLVFLSLALLGLVHRADASDFLEGKAIAAIVMFATVTTLFASLVIGALGVEVVKRYAPGFAGNSIAAYVLSIAVSVLGVFVFVLAAYRLLTNAAVTVRDVLPGAVMAAIVLEASFQIVPTFVKLADVNPV